MNNGNPAIVMPSGWNSDSKGNLFINGQAPTSGQAMQYANAYAAFLAWAQQHPSSASSKTASSSQPSSYMPNVPNWYTSLITNPAAGEAAAGLASFQYAPAAYSAEFNNEAAQLGITPAALAAIMAMQQNQSAEAKANPYGSTNVLASPLSPIPIYALSSTAISPGSTPIALPTQGTATQQYPPGAFAYLGNNPIQVQTAQSPSQQSTANKNTNLFSTWVSDIGNTIGGLANWAITPPGYTPGGQPLTVIQLLCLFQ